MALQVNCSKAFLPQHVPLDETPQPCFCYSALLCRSFGGAKKKPNPIPKIDIVALPAKNAVRAWLATTWFAHVTDNTNAAIAAAPQSNNRESRGGV